MPPSLTEAASYFAPLITELLDKCDAAGVSCRIVDIGRSSAEQQVKISTGVSWTQNSKHLPQPPEQLSEAVDIVPLVVLNEHKPDWDPGNEAWQVIGRVGKELGLRWGGDWQKHPDPSHFEYVHPQIVTDPEIQT